jgi:hypothetical protein
MASAASLLLTTSWRYLRAIAVRGQPFTQAVTVDYSSSLSFHIHNSHDARFQ